MNRRFARLHKVSKIIIKQSSETFYDFVLLEKFHSHLHPVILSIDKKKKLSRCLICLAYALNLSNTDKDTKTTEDSYASIREQYDMNLPALLKQIS